MLARDGADGEAPGRGAERALQRQPVGERPGDPPAPPGIARRAASGLWRLTRILISLPEVFDERPRGALIWRALGKMPVVGLPAGVLDERGAVRRAADETRELLLSRRSAGPAR